MDTKYLVIGGVGLAGVVLMMMMGGSGGGSTQTQKTSTNGATNAMTSGAFGSFLDMPSLGGIEAQLPSGQTGQIINPAWFTGAYAPPTNKAGMVNNYGTDTLFAL
jgi:hypothetical protein